MMRDFYLLKTTGCFSAAIAGNTLRNISPSPSLPLPPEAVKAGVEVSSDRWKGQEGMIKRFYRAGSRSVRYR
jgi:hypothetical protein